MFDHHLWRHRRDSPLGKPGFLPKHHSPSKRQRDLQRFTRRKIREAEQRIHLAKVLKEIRLPDQKRDEILRLFGYYEDRHGTRLTTRQVRLLINSIRDGELHFEHVDRDTLTFHSPEAVTDMVDSIGEVNVAKGQFYPALGLAEGEVLHDPKIRFLCPLLRQSK